MKIKPSFFIVTSHENCSVCFCARWSVLGAVTMREYACVVLCFLGLKLKAKVSETDWFGVHGVVEEVLFQACVCVCSLSICPSRAIAAAAVRVQSCTSVLWLKTDSFSVIVNSSSFFFLLCLSSIAAAAASFSFCLHFRHATAHYNSLNRSHCCSIFVRSVSNIFALLFSWVKLCCYS